MVVTLANVLLRQAAKAQGGARPYLDDLITSKFGALNTLNGQIVATTVNGKSTTLQVPSGMGASHIIAAAELALSALESGLTKVPRITYAVSR